MYLIQNPAGNNDMDGVQVEHVLQQVPHIPFLLYTNRRYLRSKVTFKGYGITDLDLTRTKKCKCTE